VKDDITEATTQSRAVNNKLKDLNSDISEMYKDIENLSGQLGISLEMTRISESENFSDEFEQFNIDFDEIYKEAYKETRLSVPRLPKLSKQDLLVSVGIGLVVTLFDFFLVGTPHKGHSKNTGSPLTDLMRRAGTTKDGKLHPVLKWLENKCKVPYDVSLVPGEGVAPFNHRLKSLGHDPILGLLFAVLDIINGTFTYIDNTGCLRIVKQTEETSNILMAIIYYFGHLISDICTSAGIPIPGWCLSQFFVDEGKAGISIATLFEEMYREGYDLRHLVSMTSSVKLGEFLFWIYHSFQYGKFVADMNEPLYQREFDESKYNLKKEKMLFIVNATAVSGNIVKFVLPPSNGNPLSLNLPQWISMIRVTIDIGRDLFRDRTPELLIQNRYNIDKAWKELLEDN